MDTLSICKSYSSVYLLSSCWYIVPGYMLILNSKIIIYNSFRKGWWISLNSLNKPWAMSKYKNISKKELDADTTSKQK